MSAVPPGRRHPHSKEAPKGCLSESGPPWEPTRNHLAGSPTWLSQRRANVSGATAELLMPPAASSTPLRVPSPTTRPDTPGHPLPLPSPPICTLSASLTNSASNMVSKPLSIVAANNQAVAILTWTLKGPPDLPSAPALGPLPLIHVPGTRIPSIFCTKHPSGQNKTQAPSLPHI